MICARYGSISPDELHPCFYCGVDILVGKASHCDHCGHLICPHCGKCSCNLTHNERKTLEYINTTYCSNAEQVKHFAAISTQSWMDKNIVINMTRSLIRCSKKLSSL